MIRRLLALALLGVLAACSGQTPAPPASAPAAARRETVSGEAFSLVTELDVERATVGDRITLRLIASAPPDVTVDFGDPPKALGSFDVININDIPAVPDGDMRRWTRVFTLTTFDSGELEIPSVNVTATPVQTGAPSATQPEQIAPSTVASPAMTISVASVAGADADPAAFRDIRGSVEVPVSVPWSWMTIGLISGGVLLLLAIVAAIVHWARNRPAFVAPPLPSHERALRELRELAASGLLDRGEFHPFHVRLADIVRRYIEERFGIMAPEQTTEEFLREVSRSQTLPPQHQPMLMSFLRQADMVKFALHEPRIDDSRTALAQAREFVETTAQIARADAA